MTEHRPFDDSLTSATCTVLEELAFLFAEPIAGGAGADASIAATDLLTQVIEFTGDNTGRLELRLPLELARKLAANMLGTDGVESTNDCEARDAAGELANIICGNMLPALGAGAGKHDLRLEEAANGAELSPSSRNLLLGVVSLRVERSVVEVRLYVEPAVASFEAPGAA